MIIKAENAYAVSVDGGWLESRMTPHDRVLQDEQTREYIRKVVEVQVLPWLTTEEKGNFLEIGCGHGTYASFFLDRVNHYIGYDIYPASLEEADQRLANFDNYHLVHGDGYTLKEVPDGSRDFVFSYQVLVHVPDVKIVKGYIKETCRVLSEKGFARLHLLGPNFKTGLHLGWLPLSSMALYKGEGLFKAGYFKFFDFLKRHLPPDLLLPKLMKSPPDHPVWKIGATISPLEAIRQVEAEGLNASVSPVYGLHAKNGGIWSHYWLNIYRTAPPFILSVT